MNCNPDAPQQDHKSMLEILKCEHRMEGKNVGKMDEGHQKMDPVIRCARNK